MGFETAVVIAIFFISALILGTTAYNVISTSEERIDEATELKHDMQVKRLQTDIDIIDIKTDNYNGSYDLTVTVTNTGSVVLDSGKLNVIVNGFIKSYYCTPYTDTWTPDETKNLTINNISTGIKDKHRVKLTTENGIADYATYPI